MTDSTAKLVVTVEDKASEPIKRVERNAVAAGQAIAGAGKKAGDGLASIGEGAQVASRSMEEAGRRIENSIKRSIALEGLERGTREWYEASLRLKGLNPEVYEPLLKQLDAARAKTQENVAAIANMGRTAKETAWALRGVPAQFTDIVTSIASGQRPLTVFLQQGGQLKDMFGGAAAAARALGGYIMGLVNPFTVAAAAIAAIGFGYVKGAEEGEAFRRELILTGNQVGMTNEQFVAMSKSIAATGVSQHAASAALTEMAGTGKLTADQIERVAAAAVKMEQAGGPAVEKLAEDFAALAKDPVAATEKLQEKYGYLTVEVYKQIRALQEEGDVVSARKLAIDAYASALEEKAPTMIKNLGYVEHAWLKIKTAAKGAIDALYAIGRDSDTLAKKQAELADAQRRAADTSFAPTYRAQQEKRAAQLQQEINALRVKAFVEADAAQAAREQAEAVRAENAWQDRVVKNLTDKQKLELEINKIKAEGAAAHKDPEEILGEIEKAKKRFEKGGGEQKQALADYTAELERLQVVLDGLTGDDGGYTELARIEAKIRADLQAGKKVRQEDIDLLNARAIAVDETRMKVEAAKKAQKEWEQQLKSFGSAYKAAYGKEVGATEEILKQAQAEQLHADSIGKTKSQIDAEKIALIDRNVAMLEATRLSAVLANESEEELAIIDRKIAAWKELKKATQNAQAADAAAEQKKQADEVAKAWGRAAAEITNDLTDAFVEAAMTGKNTFTMLAAHIKKIFADLVLRPVIQGVMAPMAGALTSAFGFTGDATAKSMVGGSSSSPFGNLGSLIPTGSFGAFGSGASISMSNIRSMGLVEGSIANFANIGGQMAAGSFLPALGMAMPYIAAAVGIGMVVKGLLDSRKGGAKSGGAAGDISGMGRFFTPSDSDAQMRQLVDKTTSGFADVYKSLGGTTSKATFAFGYDADPKGSAGSRVSAGAAVDGKQVYVSRDKDVGRDQGAVEDRLALEAKRSLLAALQASDLPKAVANAIGTVAADLGTSDEIDAAIKFGTTVKSILDTISDDALTTANQMWDDAQKSVTDTLREQATALTDLALNYDGTAASAENLATATAAYKKAAVDAVIAVRQIADALKKAFAQTRETLQFGGLGNQDKYDLYKTLADQAFEKLKGTDDPTVVQSLAEKINSYLLNAFGMLEPDAQLSKKTEFLAGLDLLDTTVADKLKAIGDTIGTDSQGPFAAIKDALEGTGVHLDSAAGNLAASASTMSDAVTRFGQFVDKLSAMSFGGYTSSAVGT